MSTRKALFLGTAAALAFGVAGCEIEQTEEGSLPDADIAYEAGQVPKYDVDVTKTQEGKMPSVDVDVKGGNLPAYKVETPSVSIDTRKVDVSVPDVDVEMKEKTVSLPDVDVTMPDEGDEDEEGE